MKYPNISNRLDTFDSPNWYLCIAGIFCMREYFKTLPPPRHTLSLQTFLHNDIQVDKIFKPFGVNLRILYKPKSNFHLYRQPPPRIVRFWCQASFKAYKPDKKGLRIFRIVSKENVHVQTLHPDDRNFCYSVQKTMMMRERVMCFISLECANGWVLRLL